MSTRPSLYSITSPDTRVEIEFYSADEKHAQRLTARLRHVAIVHWVDTREIIGTREPVYLPGLPLILLDYSPTEAEHSSMLARRLMLGTPGLSLVGVGSIGADKVSGVLSALRAGVSEFLDIDAKDEDITELLTRARGERRAAPPASAPHAPGRLVLLLGVRPGVGTSTLAAHLGALVSPGKPASPAADARDKAAQVILLDLGRPAGDATLYLNVPNEFHYDNALVSAKRIDATLIRTAFTNHDSRLTVLSQAPGTLEKPANTLDLPLLLERLRGHFDLLLGDLGGLPVSEVPLPLLREADEIWLVADQSIGSMVSLDACLRQLDELNMRDSRLFLVINRHDPGDDVSAGKIAKRFNLRLVGLLPERSRALRASANQGQLLHQVAPRDPYLRALKVLVDKLQQNMHRERPLTATPSWWKKWLRRMGG